MPTRRTPLARSFSVLVLSSSLALATARTGRADAHAPGAAPRPAAEQAQPGQRVAELTLQVPSAGGPFVVHGTLAIDPRPFERTQCPYTITTPNGDALDTQWELVARLQHGLVVELRAVCPSNSWSGKQVFPVLLQPSAFHVSEFDEQALVVALTPGAVRLDIEDQSGGHHYRSLTGFDSRYDPYRLGPATVTLETTSQDAFGGVQSWCTINARLRQLHLIVNWNDGTLPARPDVYFRSLRLLVPSGWTWTSFLPDPAVGNGYLVRPDNHVIPQRMERSFRVVVHPVGTTPDLSYRGWGVASWKDGGYLAESVPVPDLSHLTVNLTTQKTDDYNRLQNLLPTQPGDVPVSFLWPARGVKYGGMTGGIDIFQYEGVVAAATAQVDGILSLFVEQLRYASRQMGCIYDSDGRPIAIEDYRNANGTLPWSMFNNKFQGNPVKDAPFHFSTTGPGSGTAAYDPLEYEPIDDQHLIRRSKANKVLVWLDNDPLARLYLTMDATLKRMIFYEGPGGHVAIPALKAQGLPWGRAEAWAADALATVYAISDDAWRARHESWFVQFTLALYRGQMQNGLFSALDMGKVVTSPPYGHRLNEPCPIGIHTLQSSTAEVPDYKAHRANEQVYMMMALHAAEETVGIQTADMLRRCGNGLWNLAWKIGTDGLLDRYPVGRIDGQPYLDASQIPAGLTTTIPKDNYHVAGGLYLGLTSGSTLVPALYAYTATGSLQGALAALISRGANSIENVAPLLALLQQALP